ncbi:MAG: DUF3135 domain-containing protein [Gammaproteobacteria bacterium]|nr:DUF3135 domain-containing protein [Gammaproteobacteria bacterium]
MLKDLELPDFDQLKLLAETNPEELESLRLSYSQKLIDSAPERLQKRLNGLMFIINMESRRSKNPMRNCIKLSQLMMDSFVDLKDVLNEREIGQTNLDEDEINLIDNVISFPGNDNNGHA